MGQKNRIYSSIILLILLLSITSLGNATTWYVDDDNPCPGTGTISDPFCKIQLAMEAAGGGDTVQVAPGTYYARRDDNIIMKSGVTLEGSGADVTTIAGEANVDTVVGANNSIISGFTIGGGRYGVFCNSASPIIKNCVFTDNVGALDCDNGSSPIVTRNTFFNNGVSIRWSSPTIENNVFVNSGIGMMYSSSPSIINNTMVNDSGIYISESSSPTITNNIIANNSVGIRSVSSSPTISYNDLWDNGTDYDGCSPGLGDISVPPFFVDEVNNDYHLQKGSPGIDSGDPASDYSNEPEPNGGRINLGAYGNTSEATTSQVIFVDDWYVDASVPSSGDGTSWETAFKTITEGVKAARPGNTVHVAAGTYSEDVIIYWDSLELLGEDKQTTIIEGEGSLASPVGIRVVADNFYIRGFTVSNSQINIKLEESQNATLADCFIIYNYPPDPINAAGIYMTKSSGNRVTGCVLTGNFRGIDISGGNDNHVEGNILLEHHESGIVAGSSDTEIVNNVIISSGDCGIWLSGTSNTSVMNNVIGDVYARAGIRLDNNASNNIISSNTIYHSWNGIHDASSSHTNVIINNLIMLLIEYSIPTTDNAGIKLSGSSPMIVNNSIASTLIYGIRCLYSSNPEIVNNIVAANKLAGIFADESSAPVINFNNVWGNGENYSGIPDPTGINGNISVDPTFVDPAVDPLRDADPAEVDYHLRTDSPSIDTGTSVGAPDYDIDGDPRPQRAGYDMGSDEYVPINVFLTPGAAVIPRGGTLGFEVTIANNTDKAGIIYFATKVTLPNGNPYPPSGYLFGPLPVTLGPYESKSGLLSHTIPITAPLGTYTYQGYDGKPGVGIIDEDQFDFEVIEAPTAVGPEDWETAVDQGFTE